MEEENNNNNDIVSLAMLDEIPAVDLLGDNEPPSQVKEKELPVTPPMGPFDNLTDDIKNLFLNILKYRVDPAACYHGITKDSLVEELNMIVTDKIHALATDVEHNNYVKKGVVYDPILQSFVQGCGGQIGVWDKTVSESNTPLVLRGITKAKIMKICKETNRDFYYIDTGYFGNVRKKLYHRITFNDVQNFGPIIDRPKDRLNHTKLQLKKFYPGSKILLAPPSQKLLNMYDIDLDTWMEETIAEIKTHTDRPIVVRAKQSRQIRTTTNTIEMALEDDIHCLVTYSSIAAIEALFLGKPAITLGPSAAGSLCSKSLDQIENPYIPRADEVRDLANHLSYCQFTEAEMRNGTAWAILNEK